MYRWSTGRTALLALLALYALVFAALSADVMLRVWAWREKFGGMGNVLMLLGVEGTRILVVLAAIAAAAVAARRAAERRLPASFAFVILFASISLSKFVGSSGFPGAVQAWLVGTLQQSRVPAPLTALAFGHPEWTGWLALAGLLAFASRFPRPLTEADVADAGASDRRGALRGVPGAGADVGSIARTFTRQTLRSGLLRPDRLWLLGAAAAVIHSLLLFLPAVPEEIVAIGAGAAAAAALTVVLTLHRTALLTAPPPATRVLLSLQRGALAALVLVGVSAAAALLLPGGRIAVVVLPLAPLVLAVCVHRALVHAKRYVLVWSEQMPGAVE